MASPFAAETLAVNANVLEDDAPITTLDEQVITLLAALQVQSADCAPLSASGPSATLSCTGSTSTSVIAPAVATAPAFDTVNA